MTNRRLLGTAEKEVLKNLYRNGGKWEEGNRRLWENKHWTLTLLASLVVKGYVDEVEPDKQYRLAPEGFQLVVDQGICVPTPTPTRRQEPVHFPRQGSIRRVSTLRRPNM